MEINNDQQYQQFRKDYQSLSGKSTLNESDQRRFDDLQASLSKWESRPNFHGDRITGGTRTGGESNRGSDIPSRT